MSAAITPETCRWIDCQALPGLPAGTRVALFGAGQGSVELLAVNAGLPAPYAFVAIADNDATMWGKELNGLPIVSPAELQAMTDVVILITTISGKEAVSRQLEGMGLTAGRDFFAVGCYPSAAAGNLRLALEYDRQWNIAPPGARVLHVGPGGFLGLECCLAALGCETVSMDAYAFGVSYPDVSARIGEYRGMLGHLRACPGLGARAEGLEERFDALFLERNGRALLDESRVRYLHPHRFSAIPLEDESVDLALSFAVLEHVRDPARAVREIHRVLRPGGMALQRVVTRDHRSFGQVSGYHPFSYLLHDEEEWETINRDKFHQNRLLPREWEALFQERMELLDVKRLERANLDEPSRAAILARRPNLRAADLDMVNCDILVRKV